MKTITVKALKEFIIKHTELRLAEAMKLSTFGAVPSVEELEIALDGAGFDMNLQGQDSLAFEYSMLIAGLSGDTSTPQHLHDVLVALVNTPSPDEVENEDLDDPHSRLSFVLRKWEERYGNLSISEAASSIASGIMQHLGTEWV